MKETFIVRTEWADAIFDLDSEQKATIFDNLFHYHLGNENLINLNNPMVKLVWKLIQPNLIRNIDQYDKRRETSSENGKKGGRPPKMPVLEENNLNNLNENLNNLTEPNETLSVSVLDSVIVLDSENDLKKKSNTEFSKNENSQPSQKEIELELKLEKANETIKTLEEKEKKEKSSAKKESLVYNFPEDFSEEVKIKFMGFVENRKEIKKPVKTQLTLDELIESLVPFDNIDRLMAIKHSVASGWMGLFPKKTNNSSLVYHNHNKNGTASTIPSSTNKANWSAEKTALDALAISKARFAEQG